MDTQTIGTSGVLPPQTKTHGGTDRMGSGEQAKEERGLAKACDIPYLTIRLICPVFDTVVAMSRLLVNSVLFGSSGPAISQARQHPSCK